MTMTEADRPDAEEDVKSIAPERLKARIDDNEDVFVPDAGAVSRC
jgi:hypothetical protein